MNYLWKAIRPAKSSWGRGGYDVVGFYKAPRSSVLAGQTLTQFINTYDTYEEAVKAYPDAKGNGCAPAPSVNHLPCEDDPVAGGMYPDDWD